VAGGSHCADVSNTRVISADVAVADMADDVDNDVADDCAELLAWLLTGDDVAGQPGSVADNRARTTRVERGQCCRRRVSERAGMQDVGSSSGFHQ